MEKSDLPVATDQTNDAVVTTASRCRDIQILGQDDLTEANALLKGIKGLRLEVDKEFDPGIREAFAHHRTLVMQKRKWTDPLDLAEAALKPKIADYLLEQDRLAQEAARRAREAQDKMRQVANKASDEAYDKIKAGDLDEADRVVNTAAGKIEEIKGSIPAMVEKPIATGTSLRQIWTFEIVDEAKLKREAPEYTVPDMTKLRVFARTMKDQAKVPGVRFYSEATVATRIDK